MKKRLLFSFSVFILSYLSISAQSDFSKIMGVYNGNIYAGVNTHPEKSGTKNVGEIEVTKNEYGEFSLIIKKMKTATGLFPDFSIDKVSFKDRADGSIQIVHTPGIVEIPTAGGILINATGYIDADRSHITNGVMDLGFRFHIRGNSNYFLYFKGKKSVTSSIKEPTVNIRKTDDKIYDLTGRQVKNPKKGLYIINGKKQYIR